MKKYIAILLVLFVTTVSFAYSDFTNDGDPPTKTEVSFDDAKYDEAKAEFITMISSPYNYEIQVEDVESWKEYVMYRDSIDFSESIIEGVTELRYSNTLNKTYLSDVNVSLEESEASFINSNLLPPDCSYLCLNCPSGSTCRAYWHCTPSRVCMCLYHCYNPFTGEVIKSGKG